MSLVLGLLAVLGLIVVGVFGWRRWFAVFDGPDGERYRRRAAQGPFAAAPDAQDRVDERARAD